jgi:hypothetical protein
MGLDTGIAQRRICALERLQHFKKSMLARLPLIFVVVLGTSLLRTGPATADGTIYAVITLTNNSPHAITLSGAHTDNVWGINDFYKKLFAGLVTMPDGSPPGTVGSGAAMLWGSVSNGKFLATTGTGGSAFINEANTTITWSVPWTAENLGPPLPGCSSSVTPNTNGSTFSSVTVTGGFSGNSWGTASPGNNSCEFDFVVQKK